MAALVWLAAAWSGTLLALDRSVTGSGRVAMAVSLLAGPVLQVLALRRWPGTSVVARLVGRGHRPSVAS